MSKTQEQVILDLLRNTPVITVQYIQHKAAINSPRKVISDLRRKGYKIHDRMISHLDAYGTVKRYKEYWLEENEHVNAEVRS
mgnify:FL=1